MCSSQQKIIRFENGKNYNQLHSLGKSKKGCSAFKANSDGEDVFITRWEIDIELLQKKCPITCKDIAKTACCHDDDDDDVVGAFKSRAKFVIDNAKHTNLVRYLDVDCKILNGILYVDLVQEYIEGVSVRTLSEQGILPSLAPIAERVLKATSYLHAMEPKITHGYIRDGSIFLSKSAIYRIADFHLIPYLMHLKGTHSLQPSSDVNDLGSLVASKNKIIQHFTNDFIKKCNSKDDQPIFGKLLTHEFLSNAHIGNANTAYSGPLLNHFVVEGLLGSGSFGSVVKVKHPNGQKRYALKLIELPTGSKGRYGKVKREVELLSQIRHENVVEYITSWEQVVNVIELGISIYESDSSSSDSTSHDSTFPDSSSSDEGAKATAPKFADMIIIQMELCSMHLGTAIEKKISQREPIPDNWFIEITCGLAHLHQKGIIHRDLNLKNILLDTSGRVKIGDFGMATTTEFVFEQRQKRGSANGNAKNRSSQTGHVGTSYYVAPELKSEAAYSDYGKEADIYSLGMIFLEMNQYPLFTTQMERDKVLNEARKEIYPDFIRFSEGYLFQAIRAMLSHDMKKRPTAIHLLSGFTQARIIIDIFHDEGFQEMLYRDIQNTQAARRRSLEH